MTKGTLINETYNDMLKTNGAHENFDVLKDYLEPRVHTDQKVGMLTL